MHLDLDGLKPMAPPDRGKPRALAISATLHVASFFALMYAPPLSLPSLPPPSPSEYQQAFAGREDKIVWYKFHDLPDVTPQTSPKARQPLRAAVKAKQAIVSSPKNAPKRNQVIVTPAPAMELPPLDLPNLIAVKLPPKQFTTPPDLVRPDPVKIEAPDAAPDVPLEQLDPAKLPLTRLPARPYVPPPAPPKPEKSVVKIEAPSDSPKFEQQSIASTKLPATRLPARPFVPPTPQPPADPRKIGVATEAAELAATSPTAAAMPAVKLPARAYVPPPPAAAKNKHTVPAPQIDGPPGDVTMAIAGLNPSTTPVTLPPAASPAQFSAGEIVRPNGATSDGAGKGIVVNDLYAHAPGNAKDIKPDLLAVTRAPTSKEFLDEAMNRRQPTLIGAPPRASETAPAAETPRVAATRVTNAPDPRFNGRDVYMLAIQMPNLTSASGHWLMWYAERTARLSAIDPIAAPVPHHKVDPRYVPAAQDGHVEGRVQLYCVIGREGNVSSIELLRGVDDRLNRSAEEALSKWEFYPATRNGQPVDVDVVVEIPFVLAPPPLK